MRVMVPIDIPDPRFAKGMLIVSSEGTFYVHDVRSSVPTSAITGAASSSLKWEHTYELVAQKSPILRPGSVVLASEPGAWIARCNILRKQEGAIVTADTLDNVGDRCRIKRG